MTQEYRIASPCAFLASASQILLIYYVVMWSYQDILFVKTRAFKDKKGNWHLPEARL